MKFMIAGSIVMNSIILDNSWNSDGLREDLGLLA